MPTSDNRNSLGSNSNGSTSYRGEIHSPKNNTGDSPKAGELDVQQLFATLLRYKWWVLSITFGVVCAAAAIVFSLQPIYESSGTMLIEEERNSYMMEGGNALSSMVSSSYGVGTGSRLANELQILQSRTLAQRIAERIHEMEEMENGEMFPILYQNYPGNPQKISVYTTSLRLMESMVVGRTSPDADILQVSFQSPSSLESKTIVDLVMDSYMEVSSQKKRLRANSALEFLQRERGDVENKLGESEERLREYMENTNLIQVDGQTEAVIERITDLETAKQEVRVQRVAIDTSIHSYEKQLNEIKPGLVEQFSLDVSRQLEGAQIRLADLRTERALILQRNPKLQNSPSDEPQLVQLNREIEQVREEIREITSNLLNADDSDIYIGFLDNEDGDVSERIVELRRKLIELKIEESQLDAQQTVINERLAQENQFFASLPANMLRLARLKREVSINEELFTAITAKLQETELWEQTQFSGGWIVDEGLMPRRPVFPNVPLFLILGFLAGGVLSISTIAVKETLNRTLDGTGKLRELGYPLLAVIPDFTRHIKKEHESADTLIIRERPVSTTWSVLIDNLSPIADAYRKLHNNIVFADPDKDFHTILVTSSRKSEGKSTVSVNLATTIAESGKKVLLVDADLRRPNLHRLLGENRAPGISDIFFDEISWEDAVKQTAADRLDVITAGNSPPNPASILHSQKMAGFLADLKDEYDHIIIDTPPFGMITDVAPVIQRAADGTIIAARFGKTEILELNQTIENLVHIRAHIVGSVFTAYEHKKSRDYYYYGESSYAYEEYSEKVD